MELSKRLNWIIEKTDKCNTIIDVGTDHGYIPISLIKRGICTKVIASDINKDPLEKARINVSLENVKSSIDLRIGSGLKPLKKNEADIVIIAGMGGNLIKDILESDLEKIKNCQSIILQPAQNPEVLRKYLYDNSYEIIDEDVCLDDGKYYELFKVKYGSNEIKIDDEIMYEISPIILDKHSEVFFDYIKEKIEKNKKIINLIKDDTEHARDRKRQMEIKNDKLVKFLEV